MDLFRSLDSGRRLPGSPPLSHQEIGLATSLLGKRDSSQCGILSWTGSEGAVDRQVTLLNRAGAEIFIERE